MTLNERRSYRIAVALSFLFHLAILFIAIPYSDLTAQNNDLETMSPEMLDLLPGSTNPQPALVESSKNMPDRPAPPKPKQEQVTVRPQPQKQPGKVKHEVELKVEKPKQKPVKPKEKPKQEPVKPKEEPKQEPVKPKEKPKQEPVKPKEEPKQEPVKPKDEPKQKATTPDQPDAAAQTASNSKPIKDDGVKPGEAGKPPAAKKFGSGDKMVSGGTDAPFYYPKDAMNEGKEGNVKLRINIAPDGSLESIDIIEKSGDYHLDNAAYRYISRYWKFKANNEKYFIELLVIFKLDAAPDIRFLRSETRN
jgi:TonB family protein